MTSPRKKKFKSVSSAGKIMVTVFGMRKVLFLYNFLLRGTKVNSNHYAETLRSLNALLCRVHSTRKMSAVLLFQGNNRSHTSLCTKKPSQILDGHCQHIYPAFLTLPYHITCFVF